jgi:hypothetical protein
MVTKADIEAKAKEVEDALTETKAQAKNGAVWLAVGVLVVIGVAFLLGRRRGTRASAVVEVYRV